jgi:hypothetical protein
MNRVQGQAEKPSTPGDIEKGQVASETKAGEYLQDELNVDDVGRSISAETQELDVEQKSPRAPGAVLGEARVPELGSKLRG